MITLEEGRVTLAHLVFLLLLVVFLILIPLLTRDALRLLAMELRSMFLMIDVPLLLLLLEARTLRLGEVTIPLVAQPLRAFHPFQAAPVGGRVLQVLDVLAPAGLLLLLLPQALRTFHAL